MLLEIQPVMIFLNTLFH